MDNSKNVSLIDVRNNLRIEDDKAVIRRTQEIDSSFLSNLSDKRIASANSRMGDLHHVASIPTVVVEKWMAEGFNIYDKNITLPEIIKRLHSEDMAGLMATSRRII